MSEWQKVVFSDDCEPCDMCEEPICPVCEDHYADCECPGPMQEDMYEYKSNGEGLLARLKEQDDG